jgi:hypothetical protein
MHHLQSSSTRMHLNAVGQCPLCQKEKKKVQYEDRMTKLAMFKMHKSSHIMNYFHLSTYMWPYGNEVYIRLLGLC